MGIVLDILVVLFFPAVILWAIWPLNSVQEVFRKLEGWLRHLLFLEKQKVEQRGFIFIPTKKCRKHDWRTQKAMIPNGDIITIAGKFRDRENGLPNRWVDKIWYNNTYRDLMLYKVYCYQCATTKSGYWDQVVYELACKEEEELPHRK